MTMDRATMTGTSTTARTRSAAARRSGSEMIQFGKLADCQNIIAKVGIPVFSLASNCQPPQFVHLTHFGANNA